MPEPAGEPVLVVLSSPSGGRGGELAEALAVLAGSAGFLDGSVGVAAEDPEVSVLVARFASLGAWRRAVGSARVRLVATPVLLSVPDSPSAFHLLVEHPGPGVG